MFIQKIMPYLLDFSVVLICYTSVYSFFKKGFINSLFLLSRYVLSSVVSLFLSKGISIWVYESILKPMFFKMLNSNVKDNIASQIDLIYEKLPNFFVNILNSLIGDKQSILNSLVEGVTNNSLSDNFFDKLLLPFVNILFQPLFFIIFFIITGVLLKYLFSFFRRFVEIIRFGIIDSILGGTIGIFYSVILMFIICMGIYILIFLTSDSLKYLNESIIDSSFLFKLFYKFNPFLV